MTTKKDVTKAKFVELEPLIVIDFLRELVTSLPGNDLMGSFIFVHGKYRYEFNANTTTFVVESRVFDQHKLFEDDED